MTDQSPLTDSPRPKRRRRRVGLWSLLVSGLVGFAAALGIVLLIGQTMTAPDWLRERITDRLEARLGGLQIAFGDIDFVIHEGWRPRARLHDVALSDADGRELLRLTRAEASLAMRPLLRGLAQPKTIELSGAFAVLRRDPTGAMSIALGDGDRPVRQAQGLADLIEQADAAFALPVLQALTQVQLLDLNLRYEDARAGRAWTLDSGALRIDRAGQDLRLSGGFSLLSGRAYASEIELNYASAIGDRAAEFGITLRDVPTRDFASQALALAWLDVLRAPMSGALRGSITGEGQLGPLNVALTIGPGALQPNDGTPPVPFQTARTYLTFDPAAQVITFDEISVESDWVSVLAEGQTFLGGLDQGRLSDLTGQLRLGAMALNPRGLYDEPIRLEGAQADFRLGLQPFDLRVGELWIDDRGSRILLNGRAEAGDAGWTVAVDGEVDSLTPERLVEVWPVGAVPKTRTWVAANLSGGVLSDINVALRARPGDKPDVYLDFDYAGSRVQFMRNMPPVTDASGHASLVRNRFVTTATAGQVLPDAGGPVDVGGTSFIIPDVSARGNTPAVLRLQGRGSVTAMLSLLNRPPLSLLDPSGLPVTLADGQVAFGGTFAMPLKPKIDISEVEFHLDGLAQNVATDILVPGQRLEAPQMAVSATDGAVTLTADARLSGVPLRVAWTQALGVKGAGSRAAGQVTVTPDALDRLGVALPPGMVTGTGQAQFTLDLGGGDPPRLGIASDLRGIALSLRELGWSKPAGTPGDLTIEARLGPAPRITALRLSAPGLLAEGDVALIPGGGLEAARFETFRLGDWLDARGSLVGRGQDQPPAIRIDGGSLDLRRATFQASSGGQAPRGDDALVARLDRLQITDAIALNDLQGRFRLEGGLDGSFQAQVNGEVGVTGRIVPQDGRSAVRIVSDDAGGVARAAGILRQAVGGDFSMTLRPVGEPGTFDGVVEARNTYVRDAPAIAALLNAISVVGLVNELAGQGILFSEVEARFRLTPDTVRVQSARATGPSMGLTMDGLYNVADKRLAMQGVISPVYLLNQLGGLFAPRRGEGLFGFNYTLSGPADRPSVQVNPLSGLAPGFMREIFRAPDPAATSSGEAPAPRPRSFSPDER